MDYQYDASEMSSFNDYLAAYAPATTTNKVTRQISYYNLSAGGGVHRPCWQRLLDVFDNRNGTLKRWSNGYNGTLSGVPGTCLRRVSGPKRQRTRDTHFIRQRRA